MRKPQQSAYIDAMMNDTNPPPREEDDPRKRDMARRSGGSAVGIWAILGLIFMLGAVVYVVSALL